MCVDTQHSCMYFYLLWLCYTTINTTSLLMHPPIMLCTTSALLTTQIRALQAEEMGKELFTYYANLAGI